MLQILNFLQNTFAEVWWLTLIAGLSGYFLAPLIAQTTVQVLSKIVAGILVAVAIFLAGAQHRDKQWLERVAELEAQVAQAELQAAKVNERVVTRVVTRTKTVYQNTNANQEILQQTVAPQIDASCSLPVSSIVLHNRSSQAQVAAGPASTDGTPSGVAASQLLTTVIDNYSTCHQNAIKLQAWQDWYREQQAIYESLP